MTLQAYFAGAEETKNEDPIEYWSVTDPIPRVKDDRITKRERPMFSGSNSEKLIFYYKGREYEIERPLNMLKGDTLIFKAPNSKNKKISRKNITEILS